MLKDYFNPDLSHEYQFRIYECLRHFKPDVTLFTSYGQARYWRRVYECPDENGRYSTRIVRYADCYYLMDKDQLQRFKVLLRSCERDDAWDKRLAKVDAVLCAELSKSVLKKECFR